MSTIRQILQGGVGVCLLGILSLMPLAGVSAQNVTQGYQTDKQLQKGMLVRLKPGDGSKIQALTQTDGSEMLGIVVSSSDAPVSLSTIGANEQAFVATYGRYDVLVSTQNGAIKNGDFISISSLAGVGMKADVAQQLVIGKALEAFDDRSAESTTEIQTNNGNRTVALGRIAVEVSISHNPMYQKPSQAGVPSYLTKLAEFITDKPVSAFRIYLSAIILLICIIIASIILITGVRTGMIAIGRNPLAKSNIVRNLIRVTIMSLIIFVIGVIAVYLLLRV